MAGGFPTASLYFKHKITIMDKEKSLAKHLEAASIVADWAAQDVVAIPFEPKHQNVLALAEALGIFKDIRFSLYEKRPDLKPLHLSEKPSNDKPRVVYDADNPMPPHLQKYLELTQAIELLKCFYGKNQTLTDIADREIPKLKKILEETYKNEMSKLQS